jgi:hypothetical protein
MLLHGDVVPEAGHELRRERAGGGEAAGVVLAEQGADAVVRRPLMVVAHRRVRATAARELRLGLHQLRLQDRDLHQTGKNKWRCYSHLLVIPPMAS